MIRIVLAVLLAALGSSTPRADLLPPPPTFMQSSAPIIGPQDALGFDYLAADFSAFQVQRFEVSWDNSSCASAGTWVSVGIPLPRQLADTVPGGNTYGVVPPFTSGTHSWCVRAVNMVGPGVSIGPFAYAVVGSAPTVAPSNLRKIPRT